MWGWGNGELQYYNHKIQLLVMEHLKLVAKNEPNGILILLDNPFYYSSRIKQILSLDFRYGKVQARIKTVKVFGLLFGCYPLMVNGHVMVR